MHWLRRGFVGAAAAWPIALLLAPVAATRPQLSSFGYPFALVMYAAGSVICHQRPERSFHLLGVQLPVCARCTGIYVGAAVTACLVLMRTAHALVKKSDVRAYFFPGARAVHDGTDAAFTHDFSPAPRTVLFVSALPMAATLLFEWTTGHTPGNWMRAASGVPLGAAVAWIVSGVR